MTGFSYEEYYQLKEQPFSNAADSRFFYDSDQHSEAIVRILHGIKTMKGLVVMVGQMGAGKSLLASKLLDHLDPAEYEVALMVVVHHEITAEWLLGKIATELGVEDPAPTKSAILTQLYNRLMEIYEQGKKAVVIMDEANMLKTREIFEEFRGLLNLEVPGKKLICVVMVGLPDLEEGLALDPPLKQRIAIKFTLKYLDLKSTENYIKHRLAVAGCSRDLFVPEAYPLIFQFTKGVPRLINTLCDNCLLEGFMAKQQVIGKEIVERVIQDLGFDCAPEPGPAAAPQPGTA